MDVVQAVSGYISKMVSAKDTIAAPSSAKMKILLLDSETVRAFEENREECFAYICLGSYSINCNYSIRPT